MIATFEAGHTHDEDSGAARESRLGVFSDLHVIGKYCLDHSLNARLGQQTTKTAAAAAAVEVGLGSGSKHRAVHTTINSIHFMNNLLYRQYHNNLLRK